METIERRTDGLADVSAIHRDRSVEEAARLLSASGRGALLVVDGRKTDDAKIVGLLTERDLFRAIAARGPDILHHCVWVITSEDIPTIDLSASHEERLQAFCDRKTDHLVLMDGARVSGLLTIWECAARHALDPSRDPGGRPQ